MKITENIYFQNFKSKKKNSKISTLLKSLLEDNNEILNSLSKNYKNNFDVHLLPIVNNQFLDFLKKESQKKKN